MLLRGFLCVLLYLNWNDVSVSCDEGISLAFAIDDTRSMTYVIERVKKGAKAIMDIVLTEKSSEVKNYVLVTINDPDAVLRTNTVNTHDFQSALNKISVHNHNNWDCEEKSLTGIEMAMFNSSPGSYLYVFTDATAKDYYKLDAIKTLCQKKQIQVVFVLTGNCGTPNDIKYTVYHEIAVACSGQVFNVRIQQINSVLETIKVLLKGKHTVTTWKLIPVSNNYKPVEFTTDEKADYAVVSTSGKNVKLFLTSTKNIYESTSTLSIEKIMWQDTGKVLKLNHPSPGTYYAWVQGDSVVSVVVYARTDFTFDHGFSVLEPKSMKDTSKQPIAGQQQHISINVTDPQHSVEIKSVQILDMDDNVVQEMPLRETGGELYITDAFVSPSHMFKIAVIGTIKISRQTIKRISKTAIVPQIPIIIPDTIPEVIIDEGAKLDVHYGSDGTLTCKVTAYPKPTINWFTAGGTLMPSTHSAIEDALYVSYLKLKDIRKKEIYLCKASNRKGAGVGKTEVIVKPVFTTISVPKDITHVKYGEAVRIPCNIVSYLPMRVKWFRSGKELSSSGVYSISADGLYLTLASVELNTQGQYTCEASLSSYPTVKQTHSTEVKIPGLSRPVIVSTNRIIDVLQGEEIKLDCRLINAYPIPQVKWYKDNKELAHATTTALKLPNAQFTNAGQYKCVVENVMGSDEAVFVVSVRNIPKIDIVETERKFPYGSNVRFTCHTESNPPPTIVWRDENGAVLQDNQEKINEFEYISRLELKDVKRSGVFHCEVKNRLGKVTKQVNMTVPYPLVVKGHLNDDTGIFYGAEETLHCDIQSILPMKIQWYREKNGVISSRTLIHSSDKQTISRDGTELKIKFMDLDMDGKYTCEASLISDPNEKITLSTVVTIVGLSAPEIISSTSDVIGKKYKAICRVKGVPKPTIAWQFKPKGVESFHSIPGFEEELNIPKLKLSDSGTYKCIAKNALGEISRDFNLIVEERPIITNKVNTYFAVEDDASMAIPCNVTGFPDPIIVWKFEDKVIETNSKYAINGNVLFINKPVTADSKNYICEAKNKHGTATKTFTAEVTDTFEDDENYYGGTHEIIAKLEEKASIKCNLVNSDTKSVRWYLNGRKMNQMGSTYIIENVGFPDDGNYTCRVDTNEGTKSETYILSIVFLKFLDELPSSDTIDWHEDDDVLNCKSESNPAPKVEWLHNGKKVYSLNGIEETPVYDWGVFTCKLSNIYGSIQRTFKVITTGCYITKNQISGNMPLVTDVTTPSWPGSISNGAILLEENEVVKLSCPSDAKSPNAFNVIPSNEIIAKCLTEDKFVVDGKTYRYKDLQCKTKVEPSVVRSLEQCAGPQSVMLQVQFKVNGYLDVYKVCYDTNNNVPLYANVSTSLSSLVKDIEQSNFMWSSAPEVGGGKPSGGYTCEKSNKCCYSKTQLVNLNELPFGPAQYATFKDNLNSIAVWNPCDGGRVSWQEFEKTFKSTSSYGAWFSWNGASQYARKNGGLVPRYVWKVMNNDGKSSVMVYVNDESPVDSDKRCTKPCELTMTSSDRKNDKFLYCCTLDEFSDAFGIPSEIFKSV